MSPLSEQRTRGPRARSWLWLALAAFIALVQTIPWLDPRGTGLSVLGAALGLWLVSRLSLVPAILLTMLWALVAIGGAFHWAPDALSYTMNSDSTWGYLVAIPLVCWDGLKLGLPYIFARAVTRQISWMWLPAACAAIVIESWIPSVFPWRVGYSLLSWPVLVQGVELGGPGWATAIHFALAGCLLTVFSVLLPAQAQPVQATPLPAAAAGSSAIGTSATSASRWRPLLRSSAVWLTTLNLVLGTWSYLSWHQWLAAAPSYKVGLVQFDPSFVGSDEQARKMSRKVADQVDLVCWPESSGGTYSSQLADLRDQKHVFQHSREPERGLQPWPQPATPLIFGGKRYGGSTDAPEQLFVTAFLLDKQEQVLGRYDKRYLMPFGEYVPLQWFPGIKDLFPLQDEITRGPNPQPLCCEQLPRLGTLLCYEDMVPEATRSLTRAGAEVLISLINGSAFEDRLTLYQHRLLAQQRAIECRRYLVRCAATGETCVIAPTGDVQARLPMQTTDVLVSQFAGVSSLTWYTRTGDLLPWAALGMGVVTWQRGRRGSHGRARRFKTRRFD